MRKKIDLFFDGTYICSTTSSKTCKEAKERYLKSCETRTYKTALHVLIKDNAERLTARFDKDYRG